MIFPWKEETVAVFLKVPVEMVASSWVSRSNCFELMGLDSGLAAKLRAWEGALGVFFKDLVAWIGTKISLLSPLLGKHLKDTEAICMSPLANNWVVHLFICHPTCHTEGMLKIAWLHFVIVLIDNLTMTGVYELFTTFFWYAISSHKQKVALNVIFFTSFTSPAAIIGVVYPTNK